MELSHVELEAVAAGKRQVPVRAAATATSKPKPPQAPPLILPPPVVLAPPPAQGSLAPMVAAGTRGGCASGNCG